MKKGWHVKLYVPAFFITWECLFADNNSAITLFTAAGMNAYRGRGKHLLRSG